MQLHSGANTLGHDIRSFDCGHLANILLRVGVCVCVCVFMASGIGLSFFFSILFLLGSLPSFPSLWKVLFLSDWNFFLGWLIEFTTETIFAWKLCLGGECISQGSTRETESVGDI